jgi:hypothetical protein
LIKNYIENISNFKPKTLIIELLFKLRIIINILLLGIGNNMNLNETKRILKPIDNQNNIPSLSEQNEFNLIDTNSLINKIQPIINNYENLNIDSQILVLSMFLLVVGIYFTIYIFIFIVSPLMFDAIKDHLPIKVKNFMIKFISINRKVSVPFVILCFIVIVCSLSLVIAALGIIVYFNSFK